MRLNAIRTSLLDGIPNSDLMLCACGYESRSTYVAGKLLERARRRIALGFGSQQEFRYEENRQWFLANGFETICDVNDEQFRLTVSSIFTEVIEGAERPRFVIDISCMSRIRVASILVALLSLKAAAFDVSFAYNVAEFSEPHDEPAPTSVAEPVIPELSGWTTYPERPPAAVIGLGYEFSRAIGIIDHLEVNNAAWAFVPRGPIGDYEARVTVANQSLFEMISVVGRRLHYDVMDPGTLFREVNSLVDSLKVSYNPILIPLGPKIFALVAMLVGCIHREVGVWRVSSGVLEAAVDRRPSEYTTVLAVSFESSQE